MQLLISTHVTFNSRRVMSVPTYFYDRAFYRLMSIPIRLRFPFSSVRQMSWYTGKAPGKRSIWQRDNCDRFISFCRAYPCSQDTHTERETEIPATSDSCSNRPHQRSACDADSFLFRFKWEWEKLEARHNAKPNVSPPRRATSCLRSENHFVDKNQKMVAMDNVT